VLTGGKSVQIVEEHRRNRSKSVIVAVRYLKLCINHEPFDKTNNAATSQMGIQRRKGKETRVNLEKKIFGASFGLVTLNKRNKV
jgi:hypothetical protein